MYCHFIRYANSVNQKIVINGIRQCFLFHGAKVQQIKIPMAHNCSEQLITLWNGRDIKNMGKSLEDWEIIRKFAA